MAAVAARINPTWAWKWAIVSTSMFIYAGLCLYDYYIRYPKHDIVVRAWHDRQASVISREEWLEISRKHGYPDKDPGEPHLQKDATGEVVKDNYATQWHQIYVVVPLGLAGFAWLLYNRRRPLAAEEDHLLAPSGRKVPYSAVTALDKTRWDRKGIAIVHYDDNGQKGAVTIDDWVYRDADLVLEEVEARTGLTGDEALEDAETQLP